MFGAGLYGWYPRHARLRMIPREWKRKRLNRNGASNGPDSFVGHGPCNGHCVHDDHDRDDRDEIEIMKFLF